jgi:hypothetical protein
VRSALQRRGYGEKDAGKRKRIAFTERTRKSEKKKRVKRKRRI